MLKIKIGKQVFDVVNIEADSSKSFNYTYYHLKKKNTEKTLVHNTTVDSFTLCGWRVGCAKLNRNVTMVQKQKRDIEFITDEPKEIVVEKEKKKVVKFVHSGIKFNKYCINCKGMKRTRVFYSLDNRVDKRKCVTIYARDYENDLHNMFADEYINNTDSMTDYFEKGRVVLFEDHPVYEVARAAAEYFKN